MSLRPVHRFDPRVTPHPNDEDDHADFEDLSSYEANVEPSRTDVSRICYIMFSNAELHPPASWTLRLRIETYVQASPHLYRSATDLSQRRLAENERSLQIHSTGPGA